MKLTVVALGSFSCGLTFGLTANVPVAACVLASVTSSSASSSSKSMTTDSLGCMLDFTRDPMSFSSKGSTTARTCQAKVLISTRAKKGTQNIHVGFKVTHKVLNYKQLSESNRCKKDGHRTKGKTRKDYYTISPQSQVTVLDPASGENGLEVSGTGTSAKMFLSHLILHINYSG